MLIYNPDSYSKDSPSSQRALFLDRDGVINKEVNYLYRIEDFEFIDGVFDLCKTALANDYRIIVITNQSGIARNYYSEADLEKLTKWMMKEFASRGIEISKVYACPHLINADLEAYRCDCQARKPNPGMLLQAKKDFDLNLPECVFIGDKESDMEAGLRAGINKLILFYEDKPPTQNLDSKIEIVQSLKKAKEKLFKN
jgi:D-glycero-D-manno-heptose 1,7-bisphosphate phosphatase